MGKAVVNAQSVGALWNVEILGAYDIKDILKMHGFRWNVERKAWFSPEPITGEELTAICTETNLNPPSEIAARSQNKQTEKDSNYYTNEEGDTFYG